eukprot:CAMPEP_0169385478 /NCGR_PEP_ID=MMETSP1017-20121227/44108_1 /TAXON_ID=342587 /ORGANISM="Karlodinium micrum, Strain CCMP2283" /LENGTH=104 /DNA_ID=CAMNT_0009486357 /DNA_START=60 /DNA_END=374 /DNA_ORIENTATION=-
MSLRHYLGNAAWNAELRPAGMRCAIACIGARKNSWTGAYAHLGNTTWCAHAISPRLPSARDIGIMDDLHFVIIYHTFLITFSLTAIDYLFDLGFSRQTALASSK